MRRWLFIVAALIGCATPYQPKGTLLGGYEDYEVKGRPGLHYVLFEGSTATDEDVVYRYWRQRVIEVCEGKEWQVISSGGKRGIVPIRRPRFEGYVRCDPREVVEPKAPPR